MNVCIPYSNLFIDTVCEYQKIFSPQITVIHSTVPIGTTSKIENAVHSPILGRHNDMEMSIRRFTKWIGGKNSKTTSLYFNGAGINCRPVKTSEETEALKLMCLAKYGMSIAYAKYQKEICDTYKFPYEHIMEWDVEYNKHVASQLKRPVLYAPDYIGGHCVLPNTAILNEQHPNPILEEVLKLDKKDEEMVRVQAKQRKSLEIHKCLSYCKDR